MAEPRDDEVTLGASIATTASGASIPQSPPSSTTFVPGAIVAGRYRLVALLGRGGMGEVYRADDLTLDQPIALKFLSEGVANDADRLARFHGELRIARQVSHKNVCRLHDLGEFEGRRFLTMQYVDGEDLGSLLRRIGRIPQDKAVQVARQLCAGLAAAHERGVIHRDLKPANVLIDHEGNALVTDFGVAVAASDTGARLAGTPQYMAPEQLAGQAASIRSDVYSLGLVLYELFTGRRVHAARTIDELKRLHESGTITTPSAVLHDIDPAVERVILRCLDRDPARRPASALAVAAALPGANPLAAALAAGETPSPDVLAAAGEVEALPPVYGLLATASIVAGLSAAAILAPRATEVRLVPLERPPEVLADRAEQILGAVESTGRPGDLAYGFALSPDYRGWVMNHDQSANRWDVLKTGFPPAVQFWYRTSPRPLVPQQGNLAPAYADPPALETNSYGVRLDTRGRLLDYYSVPVQRDLDAGPSAAPPWSALFEAAALPLAEFQPATPQWTPATFADTRSAWEGTLPERRDVRVRVEAAAYRGHPVSFAVIWPWTTPSRSGPRPASPRDRLGFTIFTAAGIALLCGALLLARHHARTRRGDLRGATRLALFVVAIEMLGWVLGGHHVADILVESAAVRRPLGTALLGAATLWVMYVALEPYARRFWPEIMLGWSRLLSGHIKDARVGRDVLVGVAFGVGLLLLDVARFLVPPALGYAAPRPGLGFRLEGLLGGGPTIALWLGLVRQHLTAVLTFALLFVALRLITRREWLAVPLGMLALFWYWSAFGPATAVWIELAVELSVVALFTIALIRYGLLPAAIAATVAGICGDVPLTTNLSHWSAAPSNWTLAAVIALALFGYYASRAGQPLLRGLLPSDEVGLRR